MGKQAREMRIALCLFVALVASAALAIDDGSLESEVEMLLDESGINSDVVSSVEKSMEPMAAHEAVKLTELAEARRGVKKAAKKQAKKHAKKVAKKQAKKAAKKAVKKMLKKKGVKKKSKKNKKLRKKVKKAKKAKANAKIAKVRAKAKAKAS